jgi:type IV pilus assembly protein PilC
MEYVCKVGTPTGEVTERRFSAASEAALRSDLEQQGYYLFSIRRGLGLSDLTLRRSRVPTAVLLVFAQELAALLKAGLPLLQSLDVMLERQRDPTFKRSLASVREKVKGGVALSEALRQEGDLYPPIFAASLVAGERSGSLETVLRRFAQYLRLSQAVKRKALSAAIYPMVLFTLMGILGGILVVVVFPAFKDFYQDLDLDLPVLTRTLMALGTAIRGHLLWILLGVAGIVIAVMLWFRRPESGQVLDRVLMHVPYVGPMMQMFATSQLARTLSTLLSGGLPLLNALEVAARSIGNRALASAVAGTTSQIREGRSLSTALESTGMVQNLAVEMIKVGEQTGSLAEMLNSLSEFYDEELDTRISRVMALVEPLLLVVMAVIVAVMLLTFYLPMFEGISRIQTR